MRKDLDGPSRQAIARRIIALQDALGLSGKLFATRCGIKPSALTNYRKGRNRPNIDQAGRIAAGTGAPPDWILYGLAADRLPAYIYKKIYES